MNIFGFLTFNNLNRNLKVLFCGRIIGNIIYFSFIPFLVFYLDSFLLSIKQISSFLIYRSILFILGLIIGSIIGELVNKKTFVFISLFIISLLYLLLSVRFEYYIFSYSILTISFISGLIYSSENIILVNNTNTNNRAEVFSIINIITNITAFISPLLATKIFLKNTSFAFSFMGILNLCYSLLFLSINQSDIDKNLDNSSFRNELYSYFSLFKNFIFISLFLTFTVSSIGYCFLTSSLSLFLKLYYSDAKNIFTIVIMINTTISIFFQLPLSKLIKKIGNVKSFIISQIIIILFFIIITGIDNIYILYTSIFILSFGEIFKSISENLLIVDNFKPEYIGKCMSFYKIINLSAITISTSFFTHYLVKNSISSCFLKFSFISFISLVFFYFFNKYEKSKFIK